MHPQRSRYSLILLALAVFGGCSCEGGSGPSNDGGANAASDGAPGDSFVGVAPTAVADAYDSTSAMTLPVPAGPGVLPGLLVNDTLGSPVATIASYGGGTLGGTVADHAAGSSATFGAGSLVVNADGSFTFTSDAGFAGPFTFEYRLTSASGSSDATVTIDVDLGPTAIDNVYETLVDTAIVVAGTDTNALLANDLGLPLPTVTSFGAGDLGGTENDHAAGTSATFGSAGTLTVNADGGFTFTPDPGFVGTFGFDYLITNPLGTSVATATITVQAIPTIVGTPPSGQVGVAYSYALTVTGYPAPTVTVSAGSLPAGLSIDANSILGTPTASGSYPVTLTATNPAGSASITVTIDISGPPSFSSASNTIFVVGAAGSFDVTTLALPVASLSGTGTLPSGVTFVDDADGTGTLAGTPAAGTGGEYPLDLIAVNGIAPDAMQSFVLTVNESPSIGGAPPSGPVNVPYTHSFTVGGFPVPTLSVSAGSLPAGLSISGATITGTPTSSGVFPGITVTASNGVGEASFTFTLTIDTAPVLDVGSTPTFVVGTAGAHTVSATGIPLPAITTATTLPDGLTFVDNTDGTATLGGTALPGSGGLYVLAIEANNGIGGPTGQNLNVVVNEAPSLGLVPTHGVVNVLYAHAFSVSGYPAPTLTLTSGTLPPGLSLVGNQITGTPTAEGSYPGITVTAANGVSPDDTLTFDFTVDSVPTFTSVNTTTFTAGSAASFLVTTAGSPVAALTTSGALPTGITFVDNADGTGTLSGTPSATSGGSYAVDFHADNGVSGSVTQSFTLIVNQAPSISGTPPAGAVGTAYSHAFTVTGYPAPTLSLSGTLPPGITRTGNTLSGTPTTGGSYPGITVTASNGVGSDAALPFAITINQAPAFTSTNTTTFTTGTAGSFVITSSGFPAATLSQTGTLPAGVTFTNNGNGTATLAGTPGATAGESYTLNLTANNGVGSNATQTFTLIVNQAPSISGTPPGGTVGTAYSHAFTVTGYPAPTLSLSGTLPPGITRTGNTLSGTPTTGGGYPGITVTASNGVGSDAALPFGITINQAPAFTSTNTTTFTTGTAGSFVITSSGFPAAALSQTGTLPAGVTFTNNGNGTATLAGTPGATVGGSYTLNLTANNGVGSNATQTFTLIVNQAPSISGTPPAGAVGTAYSHAFTVTGYPAPTLSLSGTLPPGITRTGNTLSGTPTTSGTYLGISVTASNGVGSNATITFSINIQAAPTVTADSYPVTGNVLISIGGSGVLGNDSPNGGTLTHVGPTAATASTAPASITTTNGGTVVVAVDGSFTYNPAANYTGTDSFFYRVTNGVGNAVGTVSLVVSNMIWFVDSAAGAGGTGRLSNPFNSLGTAVTTSGVGQHIYVYQRGVSYAAAVALKTNQRLIGQGVALNSASLGFTPAANSVALPAATTNPTIVGTVTFQNGSGVHGVHVAPTSGSVALTDGGVARTGLTATSASVATTNAIGVSLSAGSGGSISLRSVSTTGGTNGIRLIGVTGSFTVTGDGATNGSGGTIANTTANSVQLTNTSATVSLGYMAITGAVYDGASSDNSGNAIRLDSTGATTGSLTVNRGMFTSNAFAVAYLRPASSGSTAFTFTNCTANVSSNGYGVMVIYEGSANANTFEINNNTFTGVPFSAVTLNVGNSFSAQQRASGRINTNDITGVAGGFASGIITGTGDNAGSTLIEEIAGNTIRTMGTMGIDVNHQPLNNNLHATVRNNTILSPVAPGTNYLYGIRLVFSSTSTPGTVAGTMCVNMSGNNIPSFGSTEVAVRLRKLGTHPTFFPRIQGFTGTTQAQLTTFIQANNSGPFGTVQYSSDPVPSFDYANATCLTP